MTGVFTNNWLGLKNAYLLGGFKQAGLATVYNTSGTLVKYNTGINEAYYENANSPINRIYNGYNTASNGTLSVRFGTSDTTPTAVDIDLGNPWSSGVSYVAVENNDIVVSGATASRSSKVVISNTAAASVTIREFGLFCRVLSGNGSGTAQSVMLYRAVLDEPITLAQYESATLTLTVSITLSNPN